MTTSYTISDSITFTETHARHIAAKVATDLKRMQRFYENPSDVDITQYEIEVIELLKKGYLGTVTYGFRRNGDWIEPTLRFTARDLAGLSANNDDPGRIRPGKDTSNATFYSYLTYSTTWDNLSEADKEAFKARLPFRRGTAPEPGINGYLTSDLTYSAAGRALDRASVRSF
jgi:hypothetical protein